MPDRCDVTTIKTTCPYCGVGCGVLANTAANGVVTVQGDPDHPANFGKLCSKGSTLADTLGSHDRILYPEMGGERASWDDALGHIAGKLKSVIDAHGPDAVAFYVSGQFLTEDYYVANKLMKGYIGAANIDTNSRLCMASSVVGHKKAFGGDIVPGNYEDLEEADLIILIGSNMAWCHPILFQRILRSQEKNANKAIIVLDPRESATTDAADMHLPLRPGSDVPIFMGLFKYLEEHGAAEEDFVTQHTNGHADLSAAAMGYDLETVADLTGLSIDQLETFYAKVLTTDRTVTVYSQGVNQAKDGTDKVSAIVNCHLLTGRIGKVGAGPFSITGQPNAMGGREVGGLANQLASHLDITNRDHRRIVQQFWKSPVMASGSGLTAVDMFDAVDEGKIKAIWIMATNPVVSMPNADKVKRALNKCELVVVSDIYHTSDTAKCADILLPSTGWSEKDGMVTNSERRMSRQRPFVSAVGEARHDWWQLCQVARLMEYDGFDFEGPADIFREYAQLSTAASTSSKVGLDLDGVKSIDADEYEAFEPKFWPINQSYPDGRARLFDDGDFFTINRKANFVTPANHEAISVSKTYPLILNTGRVRDHWHTMTRTGRAARLSSHIGEPFIEIHPKDAARFGLNTADIASVESKQGNMLARVSVTDRQKPGSMFAPMHFSSAMTAKGRVGALAHALVDPFSDQPAFKSTAVQVEKQDIAWFGFAAFHLSPDEDINTSCAPLYWAKATTKGGRRFEMAGDALPSNWGDYFRSFIDFDGCEFLEVQATRRNARLAAFDGTALKAVFFVSEFPVIVSRDWICTQLGSPFDASARQNILAGSPGADMPDKGRIICACMDVGANQINDAIKQGCQNLSSIGVATKAGTNCGSCQSDILKILETQSFASLVKA
jgi:assimilatory nitrate reductase catalytic subunit